MQFFNPNAFLLLWVLPLLAAVFMLANRAWEKRLERFGNLQTLRTKLMPGYRNTRRVRPFYLVLAFLFAVMALARPQWGEEKKKVERKGVNIIFLQDTSLSMLAEDIKPNRLEKSKLEIKSFIRRLKGDRIGMVAFSGSGFLQSPLTLDYSAFLLFLDAVKTGYIPDPGTSLDRAVRLAIRSFPEKEMKYKSLILFTDGEDHEGGMEQSVEEAKKAGVRIYTIGVGTAEGAPIPLRDEEGQKGGFKKDRQGQVVITKLNKPLLEKMASETGGLYLPSTPGEQEIDVVLKHLAGLGQKQFQEKMITEKEDHFQFFLFWALIFLAAEMLIRQNKATATRAMSLLLAAFLLFSGFLESPTDLNEKGNQQFRGKKYQSALESYRKAGIKKPDDPAIQYNLASTLYKVNEYQEASQSLEKSIGESNKDPALRAKALYNYGNTQYRLGNFEKAIDAYQMALEINPKDVDAKYNLEFLQKEKSEFEKKNQERNKDQQQQQQNQDQQQNQQQNQQDQKQEQQSQNQDQSGGQEQEQEEKNQGQQKEDQQDKESQSEQQKDQQEKQNQEPQEKQGEEKRPEEGQEKQEQQEQEPQEQGGGQEDEQPSEGDLDQQKAPRPLQGQMTMENALRILDAMKESEKELQDLRRPPVNKEPPQVAKDW